MMEKFITSFRFPEEILTDCQGKRLAGCGDNIEVSEENLIERVVEKIRAIISERRLNYDVLTEYGFYIPYSRLDEVPPKEEGWEDWCLIVCCPWDDDNIINGPYRYSYLYVPKGSVIKTIPKQYFKYQGEVKKIKVESKDYQFLNYDLDDCCCDGLFELPNFSFVWMNGKWVSRLRFGG